MSFSAGAITGGIDWDISSYTRGMLQAESIAHLFPEVVADFLAHPLLGLAEVAKEAFNHVREAMTETINVTREVGEEFHHLHNDAIQAGVSMQFLSSLGAAARESGAGIEEIGLAMKFLNRNAAEAAMGNQQAAQAFATLGISVSDAAGSIRPTEELFLAVADGIGKLESPALRVKFAMDLMGRGGAAMIPFFKEGRKGIEELMAVSAEFGATVGKNADGAAESFGKLDAYWFLFKEGIKQAIAAPGLKLIEDHLPAIEETLLSVSQAVRGAVGQAFTWLGTTAIPAVVEGFGWVQDNADALMAGLAAIGGVILGPLVIGAFTALAGVVTGIVATLGAPIALLTAAILPLVYALAGMGVMGNVGAIAAAVRPVLAGLWENMRQGASWIRQHVIPVIGSALAGAMTFATPVVRGLGTVFSGLLAILLPFWEMGKAIAAMIWTRLGPGLESLKPVLSFIGNFIGGFISLLGDLLKLLGGAITKIGEFFGLLDSTGHAVNVVASGSTSGGGPGGNSGGGGGGAAGNLTVNNQLVIDPEKAGAEAGRQAGTLTKKAVDDFRKGSQIAARSAAAGRGA